MILQLKVKHENCTGIKQKPLICQDTVITVFNVFGDTMAYQDRQL